MTRSNVIVILIIILILGGVSWWCSNIEIPPDKEQILIEKLDSTNKIRTKEIDSLYKLHKKDSILLNKIYNHVKNKKY